MKSQSRWHLKECTICIQFVVVTFAYLYNILINTYTCTLC